MKYLIYAKYSDDSDYEFLSTVANNNCEGTIMLEDYHRYGMIGRMVPASKLFKDCKNIDQKICRILMEMSENGIDEESYSRNVKHFSVDVDGDWKHSHMYCDNILTKLFKCNLIKEETTWEDGSDCYGSIHTYCL